MGEERVQVRTVDPPIDGLPQPLNYEPRHDRKDKHHEAQLHRRACLGSDHVDQREQADQDEGQRRGVNVQDQDEVGAHPDHGEGVLEHQRKPRTEPGHRAHRGSERPLEEVVGTSGLGQRCGQFGHA